MKKLVLSLGILLSGVSVLPVQAASIVLAQTAMENGSAKRIETIKSVCKTTPEQNSKIESLFKDYDSAEEASKKANKGNPEAMKEATKKNNYDLAGKLAKVLSPEQRKSLQEYDVAKAKEMKTK